MNLAQSLQRIALADPGRAMVELRRLIDLYPDRRATLRLRRELAILKDERWT